MGPCPTLMIRGNATVSNYRRANFPGGYYFFTVVTYNRRKLFIDPQARDCLRSAWQTTRGRPSFETIALCLLPDHLHCIWKLPEGDANYSSRWNAIKGIFSKSFLAKGGCDGCRNVSRQRTGEAALWQRRFWEHQIRDETDLQRHVDYIHYNPIKHGLVTELKEWPWSTYHRYLREGRFGDMSLVAMKETIETLETVGE